MVQRYIESKARELLSEFPALAIIGPRQVGKTTLAKILISDLKNSIYLDLESPRDLNKLSDPETFLLQQVDKTIVIDEVQRKKELFPVLRSIIDRNNWNGRFVLLGSASPDLIRDSSESLAGRIAYLELTPFLIQEIEQTHDLDNLWFRGGFPEPFLLTKAWLPWMENFVRTYIERDLPMLGLSSNPIVTERFWRMLAHYHGSIINMSELSKSLEVSVNTIKGYLAFFENAFLIRILQPYHSSLKKRIIKSPKVYFRDSGILHYFLGLEKMSDVYGHPKLGASWEGFVIEKILSMLPGNRKGYFFRTFDGSEIDLIIEKGGVAVASIEIKIGSDNRPSKGNTHAIQSLKTRKNFIIIKENDDYAIKENFRIVGIENFLTNYLPDI